MSDQIPLVISFSGGRTSAFMARALQVKYQNQDRELIFIFANTGKERLETLNFVNDCDKRWNLGVTWIEYDLIGDKSTFKITSYETASRNGEPFEKMITKYGIPNKAFPHCSRELKRQSITRYLRTIGLSNGMYETAIGIRFDELHRINWSNAKRDKFVYPLATDFRVNKEFIRNWWSSQSFDLALKDYEGNCDMCWKKSERKLLTMIVENPKLIEWWVLMEFKYGGSEYSFYRNNKTAPDLIELAKQKFKKAIDEHELSVQQHILFDYELDFEHSCFCNS